MRLKFLSLFLLFSIFTLAQRPVDEVVPISSMPRKVLNFPIKKTTTALSLPFYDDFSYDSHRPDSMLWSDDNVYINQTWGIAPPTLGVATFDGLDRFGLPYDINYGSDKDNPTPDTCDVLTSQFINLSSAIDSVYLSFFWEAGGLGEDPEGSDSLNLQFYIPATGKWQRIWGISGVDSTSFKQVMIPVPDAYQNSNFRFRFMSFGNRAGALDMWHIDRVFLNDQRNYDDTLFTDPSFTRPHPSLLQGYAAIPWFHYDAPSPSVLNKQNVKLYYQRNVRPAPSQGGSYNLNLGVYKILYNGTTVLAKDDVGDVTLDNGHPYYQEVSYNVNLNSFVIPSNPTGEFEITAIQTYTGLSNLGQNDSIVHHQVFKNYYAYDDGSAERGYQVRDNDEGFIIAKYNILQQEDLKGLYIYFLPSQYNIGQNSFSIVVYANNNGIPGNLIYESDSSYVPQFTTTNFMMPYMLSGNLPQVDGEVFIGIRQHSNVRLPIGLDVSSPTLTTSFFGYQPNNVYQNFHPGNLMMRPILRYAPADLTIAETDPQKLSLNVFPNPASNKVFIQVNGPEIHDLHYILADLSGKLVQEGKVTGEINLSSNLTKGLYILQITDTKGKLLPFAQKILVER